MKLNNKDVEYIANLARLEITEKEKEKYASQLTNILDYVSKLNQLDTEDIEPTSHVLSLQNVFREDKINPSLNQEESLFNAPEKENNYFKVKKVIE